MFVGFNNSITQSVVPSAWKLATVIPIPKVQPPKSIEDDLRPISLTPTLAKQPGMVCRTTNTVCGFVETRPTTIRRPQETVDDPHLADLIHRWHMALDRGESIRAVFVDFAKAFDHADHGLVGLSRSFCNLFLSSQQSTLP